MSRPVWRAVVGWLVLFALASGSVRAGDATLGGTLGASDRLVRVASSASVPVSVALVVSDGWALEVDAFALDPGTSRTVRVVEQGPAPGLVTAYLAAVAVVPGTEATALVLSTGLEPPPVIPPMSLILLVLAAIGVVVLVAWPRYERHAME